MSREQFLNEFRIALQGQIPQAQVNEQLRYYENYIIEESRKGRSEDEVINALGNPRLIAKTIIETNGKGSNRYQDLQSEEVSEKKHHSWYGIVIAILIVLLIVGVITRVAIALLPIILPVVVIILIFRLLFSGK